MTAEKPKPMCSDLCEHCNYIECGDFVCDVVYDEVTIIAWKPFPCVCPEKRRLVNDSRRSY